MQEKLEAGKYTNFELFIQEINQMLWNAFLYIFHDLIWCIVV